MASSNFISLNKKLHICNDFEYYYCYEYIKNSNFSSKVEAITINYGTNKNMQSNFEHLNVQQHMLATKLKW